MKAQLRMHPRLKYHGARTWPPDWGGAYTGETVFPIGEQGILEDVSIVKRDLIGPQRLDLTIKFGGHRHSGQVWVDEPELIPRLHGILEKHIGEPMSDIGALEVDL